MFRHFVKYHGSGNDFVVVHERFDAVWPAAVVADICHRRYGVGADGFMVVGPWNGADFRVDYYNADGRLGSLCGNGSRCAVDFARNLGLFDGPECRFVAADGVHVGHWHGDGQVTVLMADAPKAAAQHGGWFADTGSPHHVAVAEGLDELDVVGQGRNLRYGVYGPEGANINWILRTPEGCRIRTYERGVEDETLSCGTGAVAAALTAHQLWGSASPVRVQALGGDLEVSFTPTDEGFRGIALKGPVARVFEGTWTV